LGNDRKPLSGIKPRQRFPDPIKSKVPIYDVRLHGMSLHCLGSNGKLQLGQDHDDDVHAATRVTAFDAIDSTEGLLPTCYAGGGNHSCFIIHERLYILGHLESAKTNGSIFPVDGRWKLLAATWEAVIAATVDDEVYALGRGLKGELGHPETVLHIPTRVNVPRKPIQHLAASVGHVVVVYVDGSVYGWGAGRKGQLGTPAEKVVKPRRLDVDRVSLAGCGHEYTFFITHAGECRVLGGDKHNLQRQCPRTLPSWKQVACSWGGIHVLMQDLCLISWGRNDHNQLAPDNLPPVFSIASGSEHTVALGLDSQVYAWGWGEHGNLGGSLSHPHTIELGSDKQAKWIGAGCATTFIYVC